MVFQMKEVLFLVATFFIRPGGCQQYHNLHINCRICEIKADQASHLAQSDTVIDIWKSSSTGTLMQQ